MANTASSPAFLISFASSCFACSMYSSMRPGWMRPSFTSFSSAMRAICRRIREKLESVMVCGVSSIMISTPVSVSSVRILRPSFPMMRPFMSSEGRGTVVVVLSDTTDIAQRCIASAITERALNWTSSKDSCSAFFMRESMSSFASRSTLSRRTRFASSFVRPAIFSSFASCSSLTRWISPLIVSSCVARSWSFCCLSWRSRSFWSKSPSRRSRRSCVWRTSLRRLSASFFPSSIM